ncbi:unnamed protein product [Durusdinium trenchii]|uniref:Uncharacterized protein n=1 Tax=Durusdinium trenchii TaxID=1381693 RepID=A0ABP0NQL0_9DINO
MTTVKKEVTERLSEAVRARGMLKFLHHDVISKGLFSTNFTSASGESESWKDQLRNREDGQLVDAFVTRLIGDFDKSAKSLRKAITFKEAVIIHQSTGCFLHFLKAFQQMAPASFFDESKENLLNQFNQGFLDPDLCHILTLQVPPGDIKSVAAFRPLVAKIDANLRTEKEEKEARLAQDLRQADYNALHAKLTADFELLEMSRKGKEFVDQWMATHCLLVDCSENMTSAVQSFLKFKEQFRQATDQKGPACYAAMIDGLLEGLDKFADSDKLLFVDVLPNRFAECGRALIDRNLKESGKTIHYCGFLLNDFQTNLGAFKTMIYNACDQDPLKSPPKERPQRLAAERAAAAPDLQILAWSNGRPIFPAALLTRFTEASPEFQKIQDWKKRFDLEHPAPLNSGNASQPNAPARAGGHCDFQVDSGRMPLDILRCIELPAIAASDFTSPRRAECAMVGKKPAIAITQDFSLFIGNTSDAELALDAGELFGFGRGTFDQKEIRDLTTEIHGVAWRLVDDLALVSYNKRITPLCQYLRTLATDHGLSEVDLPDHVLSPRLCEELQLDVERVFRSPFFIFCFGFAT